MFERKDQIFKESTTNKIPSLQTPSKTIGGFEGRRLLSDDSVHTNSKNKNKNLLQKNPKKSKKQSSLKKNPPGPTKRDLFLLEQLESFGVLSTQQIRKLIFKSTDTRTVLRRLRFTETKSIEKTKGLFF